MIRWEESKKWQKKVESLKNKLTEKIREVEDHQKQIKSLKDTVERCVCAYVRACMRAYMHACVHVCICACVPVA